MEISDKEYLSRPLLQGAKFIIGEERIVIATPSTQYITIVAMTEFKQKDMLDLYSKVYNLAKGSGVKIKYTNHYSKQVKALWPIYENELAAYKLLYKQLQAQATIVLNRGLHIGTVDDRELAKATKLAYRMIEYHYRTSAYSHLVEVNSALHRLLESVEGAGRDNHRILKTIML